MKMRKSIKIRTPEPVSKTSINWVAITTMITLTIPVLYIIGRAYDESYLKVYGVSADLFQRSTQDYLYFALFGLFQSFWDSFLSLIKQSGSILVESMLVGLVILLVLSYKSEIKPKLFNIVDWGRRHNQTFIFKVIASALSVAFVFSVYLFAFILVLFVLAGPVSIGTEAGKHVAEDEIKNDKGICTAKERKDLRACISVSRNDKVVVIGRVISGTATNVAIAKDGNVVVLAKEGLNFEVMK